MSAELEELRQVHADITSKEDPRLSDEEIEKYFQKIILVADSPRTCEPVCWEVGLWLLLLSNNKQDYYFNKFGYDAIRISLVAALKEGCLPKGLGWIQTGFVPNEAQGDIMLGVLSTPDIDTALRQILPSYSLQIDLALVDPDDEKQGGILVNFLSHLHRFGLSNDAQLMWAARLVQHFSPKNGARYEAMKLVLACLIKAERFINAFYWLQWIRFSSKAEDSESVYLNEASVSDARYTLLLEIIKILETSLEVSDKTLADFLQDSELLNTVYTCDRCKLLIMLTITWLMFIRGKPINVNIVEVILGDLLWKNYPELSSFIQTLLNWSVNVINRSDISSANTIPAEFLKASHASERTIIELRTEMYRNRSYRNMSLPLEIWKDSKENIFLPLLISLETSTSPDDLQEASREIEKLDANTIISETRHLKHTRNRGQKLEADVHQMLIRDFNGIIGSLKEILSLCANRFIFEELLTTLQREINWLNLDKELEIFSEQWPSMQESVNKYLIPIFTAFEFVRENRSIDLADNL